jgi:aspartate/methionine/tyrosine aminotransferase
MAERRDKPAPTPKKRGTDLLYSLIAQARQYDDAVILGRGDPDLDTPSHIVAAANAAIEAGYETGSPVAGLDELREAIARRVKRVNNIDVDPETEVVVTNGGQEAIFLIVNTLLSPGDEIIVPVPTYNSYNDAISFAGAVMVDVPTRVDEGFHIDPDRVRAAITDRTKSLLMVSPNNPTASVIAPATVRELVKIAVENRLTIIADDIYDQFLYDGAVHLSPASLSEARECTLTLNSVSKAYAMTGWRAGWVVGPADLMKRLAAVKAGVSGPTSVIAQRGAIAALNGPQDCVREAHEIYERRRQIVLSALGDMGFTCGLPEGGQFAFADISSTGLDSVTLVKHVLDKTHVLIYPGFAFGQEWESFIRVTFLQPEEVLRDALERAKHEVLTLQA